MKRKGPDSLRSWVVAGLCCFITTVVMGLYRLTSFIFVDSMHRYGVGREAASFPFTLAPAVISLSGPFVGFLAPKLGQRITTCLGCSMAAIGVGCCFLAESTTAVTVLWGVIHAMGHIFCLSMLPIFIIQHFNKRRGSALALSGLGMSFGNIIFPPIYEILMSNYGLSGTFLLLSGFLLNCIPAALLLQKPDVHARAEKQDEMIGKGNSNLSEDEVIYCKCRSNLAINSFIQDIKLKKIAPSSEESSLGISIPAVSEEINDANIHRIPKESVIADVEKRNGDDEICHLKENCYVTHTKVKEFSKTGYNSIKFKEKRPRVFQNFRVFLDPMFQLITFTNSMNIFLLSCFITIIVDFAVDIEIEETYHKYVPISLAAGEIIGRLFLGRVIDRKYIKTSTMMAINYLGLGIMKFSIAWSSEKYMFNALLACNGCFTTLTFVLFPLLVADCFDADKQIVAISSGHLYAGPVNLLIPSLIGFFRDRIGSYKYFFIFLSAIHLVAGVMMLMTPCVIKCRKDNLKEECEHH